MDEKKSQKREKWQKRWRSIKTLAIIAAIFFLYLKALEWREPASAEWSIFLKAAILPPMFFLPYLIDVAIHEFGHVLGGWLTGCRLRYMRVGRLLLVNSEDRLRLHRWKRSVGASDGEASMSRAYDGGTEAPIALFYLGGAILNAIFALLFGAAGLLWTRGLLSLFLLATAIFGIMGACINIIPITSPKGANDGATLRLLRRDPIRRQITSIRFAKLDMFADGVRLRDMPEEWFELPEGVEAKSDIGRMIYWTRYHWLLDAHRFAEADAVMTELLEDEAISEGMRLYVEEDRMTLALLGYGTAEITPPCEKRRKELEDKHDYNIDLFRNEYIRLLLQNRNLPEAMGMRRRFERAAARAYVYPSDVVADRELIAMAEELARERGILPTAEGQAAE